MQNIGPDNPIVKRFNVKRKAVTSSQEEWVRTEELQLDNASLLMMQPVVEGVDLVVWAAAHRELIESTLLRRGAILFRGFDSGSTALFEDFIRATFGEPMGYQDRATPRSQVSGNIYSSTDYPPEHHIELHNESSYAFTWPMRILFLCVTAAKEGGETPIADSRKVFQRISPAIRDRFIEKKVMYVRNFGEVFGMPWQTVFQTSDIDEAAEYCRKNRIEMVCKQGGGLRTHQVREAVAKHPKTGEMVWFNQATAFHISTLPPAVREALLEQVEEEDVPKNAYYGDGSRIEESVLDEVREAYRQETIAFSWQNRDILMLDNMLFAHGRRPFVGQRKVVAGMAQPINWTEV